MASLNTGKRMKQHRGFTLISGQSSNGDGTICKGGYKFTGRDSRSAQILDSQGHGIPCGGAQ